jgi:hypothetical protein
MKKEKIKILDEEVVVYTSDKGEAAWGVFISVIMALIVITLSVFLYEYYPHVFENNTIPIAGFAAGFFISTRLTRIFGKPSFIVVDRKYFIIHNDFSFFSRQRVYKLEDIRNWTINRHYRITPWKRISHYFIKDSGGCILFNYADMKMPLHFGYGLTADEADTLLSVLREKGWIEDYWTAADARLEYRTKRKVLNVVMMLFGICGFVIFGGAIFVKEEYLRSLDLLTVMFPMLLLIGCCFVMVAIISFFHNKKEKKRAV